MGSKDERASFCYLQWQELYNMEKPYEIFIEIPEALAHIRRTNLVFEESEKQFIKDIRGLEHQCALDEEGFQVLRVPTAFKDFSNRESVEAEYLPECEQLLKNNLEGADRLRHGDMSLQKRRFDLNDPTSTVVPAKYVHVDESESGSYSRIRSYMKNEAEELLKGRVRLINIWRPLKTVEEWPLAFCDSRTLNADDLVASDNIRSNYIRENLFAKYNPLHRWYYVSNQQPDEVTLLKIFDSANVPGKRTPHAAFNPGSQKPNAPFRESIEVRMLVFTQPV